jgi:hypothetical protein
MTIPLADAAPVSDLLDVFNTYNGATVFQGLAEGIGGKPAVLGAIGWIFTGFGALFVLWGFVLRTQRSGGEGKMEEVAKTWIVIGFMVGGPLLMRASMEGADSLYASSFGSPANLTTACVKAAYAMPELNRLLDVLASDTAGQPQAPAGHTASTSNSNDGVLGYIEAKAAALRATASEAASTWNSVVRLAAMATRFGSAGFKFILIALTLLPLYLLLLAAAGVVWFMQQLRFFLAVSGAMMLPLFVGMFSLPSGHFGRQAAQGYVMNMVSLALWPVAWAIGHSGTVVLYNALIALIAGTSRVPDLIAILQWNNITTSGVTAAQMETAQAALGNWFMGNIAAVLSLLVGGIGFVLWVFIVSIMGPVILHKVLTSGALFMAEAAGTTARQGAVAGRMALDKAETAAARGKLGLLSRSSGSAGNFETQPPILAKERVPGLNGGSGRTHGDVSIQDIAQQFDNSGGKGALPM